MQRNTDRPTSTRNARIAVAVAVIWTVGLLAVHIVDAGTLNLAVILNALFAPITLILVAAAVGLTLRARRNR